MAATNKNSFWKLRRINIAKNKNMEIKILV